MNPEARRPTPIAYPRCSDPKAACTCGNGYPDCGGEVLCGCTGIVSAGTHGKKVGPPNKGLGDSPADVFNRGGSENIPLMCRDAQYHAEGAQREQAKTWLEEFYSLKRHGREWGSAYRAVSWGNDIVVLNRARKLGHARLAELAAARARSYTAAMALMAVQQSTTRVRAWRYNQATGKDWFSDEALPPGTVGGFGVATPSNRPYPNKYPSGQGGTGTLLSMALDHPTRVHQPNMDQHGSTFACGPFKTLNIPFKAGHAMLREVTPEPETFGLSALDRWTLKQFILSNGTRHLDYVLAMVGDFPGPCYLTIIRTTEGITAWAGVPTNEARTRMCMSTKGAAYLAVSLTGGVLTSLSRVTVENFPHLDPSEVWREGNEVCAQSEKRPKKCIAMVGGSIIYQVHWPRDGSPVVIH